MVNTYLNAGEREVKNNAGGSVFQVKDMDRLERFLILGTVGGTYYVGERDLTKENLSEVTRIINEQGTKAVDKIVEIGVSNRAPKHDPVLVALAIAVSASDPKVRAYALTKVNDVVRTGTHMFHFLAYVETRRGWGRGLRNAIGNWYNGKSDYALANQVIKYKQRDGWSHRDALRLSHPIPSNPTKRGIFKFVTQGTLEADDSRAHAFIEASIEASTCENVDRAIELIKEFNLPREALSTKVMKDRRVWEALVPHMGMTALLRNLRNMTKDEYLVQGSDAVREVYAKLTNEDEIRKSRVHPAQVFLAIKNATDVPRPIKDALEDTFYKSFGNVKPTNKRILLALDVSGSMDWDYGGVATAREWSALQAMVTARVEPFAEFKAFSHELVPVDITKHDSLKTIIRKLGDIRMGGTDCSLPMQDARVKNEKFDAFVVYTDNETWYQQGGYSYGRKNSYKAQTPMEALREYRKTSGIHDAKLAVVGIASSGFTIADPNDFNTLDVVGFDAGAPAIMSDFIAR